MPAYILACDQTGIPSTVSAADGSVSMVCSSGTVSLIEYQPSIFVPLSADDAMQILTAAILLWGVAWVFRLLTNFISERYHHEIE